MHFNPVAQADNMCQLYLRNMFYIKHLMHIVDAKLKRNVHLMENFDLCWEFLKGTGARFGVCLLAKMALLKIL